MVFTKVLPFGMFFKLVENCSITKFEDEMEFPLPPKNFDQIDQIRVLQILVKIWNKFQFYRSPKSLTVINFSAY